MTAGATSPGAALRSTFGRLWAAAAASNLADGILFAGLPLVALQLTDSPALVAGVAIALQLPMALTALPAGVVADRMDRRVLLLAGNLVRALGLVAALVAVAVGEPTLALVYAVAALAGSTEVVVDTAAQTSVPLLVPRGALGKAHARLGGTQVLLNDAIGAPIGSLLAGMGIALFLSGPGLLFGLAAALVLRLRLPAPAAPVDAPATAGDVASTVRRDLAAGLRYLWANEALRTLAVVGCVFNFGTAAFFSVFPVFVVGPLGLPPYVFGWYLAVIAAGGLVGSVAADRVLAALGLSRLLRTGSLVVAAIVATIALVAEAWTTAVCVLLLGGIAMIWNVGVRVLRQSIVPDHLLGRVTAATTFVALIAAPVGALLGGTVAELAGVRWSALVTVLAIVYAAWRLRRLTHDAVANAMTNRD